MPTSKKNRGRWKWPAPSQQQTTQTNNAMANNTIPGSLTPNAHQMTAKKIANLGWYGTRSDVSALYRLAMSENFSIRSIEAWANGAQYFDYQKQTHKGNPPATTFMELTHTDGRGWICGIQMGGYGEVYFSLYMCRTRTAGACYNEATDRQSVALDKLIDRNEAKLAVDSPYYDRTQN